MPAGRFLSKAISKDEAVNQLSWQAHALYMMAISHLDRDGIITGHPLLLMSQIAPLRAPDLVSLMPSLIREWIDAELVISYDSSGKAALFFPGFLKHQRLQGIYQRESPSEFDPPPGYERTADGLVSLDDAAPTLDTNVSVGPSRDEIATNSRPDRPIKQQSSKVDKDTRLYKPCGSSNSSMPARPSARAAPAGDVNQEIYTLLREFGVADPALTELASNGSAVTSVQAWTAYLATQNMRNPVGYLVKRLRSHDPPPPLPSSDQDDDSYESLRRRYGETVIGDDLRFEVHQ